ncbi:TlpA family protein disulfide reductase [bacterium]|nr:TlpA family protein disulfide reductase [bacterium]
MMRIGQNRWALVLSAWMMAPWGSAWGQEPGKTEEPPAKDERHPVLVELEAVLKREASSEEELFNNIREAVKLSLEVRDDKAASPRDRDIATSAAFDLTFQAYDVGVEGFDKKLRELCEAERAINPPTPFRAKASFYLFALDNYDEKKEPKEGILVKAEEFLKEFSSQKRMGFELLMELADRAMQLDKTELAVQTYQLILKKFPDTSMTESIEGTLRRLEAIGKDFVIEGTLLSGEKLDAASLKGKVIVIDFWATWCGPCLQELPELKRVYEELHEKGFEVIGVSLDEERAELEAFLEEQRLPWPQLFPPKDQPNGWENPFTRKYGISGIPTVFLIGKDGKLVSTSLRGPKLEEKVRELLGVKS